MTIFKEEEVLDDNSLVSHLILGVTTPKAQEIVETEQWKEDKSVTLTVHVNGIEIDNVRELVTHLETQLANLCREKAIEILKEEGYHIEELVTKALERGNDD